MKSDGVNRDPGQRLRRCVGVIRRDASINKANREANRLKLARLIVVLAKPGDLDREWLRDSAILHFRAGGAPLA